MRCGTGASIRGESNSPEDMITVDTIWNVLRTENSFFSVTFERRTNRKGGSAVAGDTRTMLCRTGMSKYKKGVIPDAVRDAEDFDHGVLTVWSMDAYMKNRNEGMDTWTAGMNAWRRIDVMGIQKCSLIADTDLPPSYHAGFHNLTNQYRLAHMPALAV